MWSSHHSGRSRANACGRHELQGLPREVLFPIADLEYVPALNFKVDLEISEVPSAWLNRGAMCSLLKTVLLGEAVDMAPLFFGWSRSLWWIAKGSFAQFDWLPVILACMIPILEHHGTRLVGCARVIVDY